ncbi:hypothetical protein PAPYR_11292 [Paratrimastix pyriformis]|uniref:Uncharacterized protein n=1 Tax=Paratrimastix pyriformis TaxID=342808 RepID=A0ABQ8UBC1_9EUKA|nr:hypothetical protein PAPYR_11292 [Paratrimastix pyriformis]
MHSPRFAGYQSKRHFRHRRVVQLTGEQNHQESPSLGICQTLKWSEKTLVSVVASTLSKGHSQAHAIEYTPLECWGQVRSGSGHSRSTVTNKFDQMPGSAQRNTWRC